MVMGLNLVDDQKKYTQPTDSIQPVNPQPSYLPTNGETPLASLPKYGGSGGDQASAEYYAGQDFFKQFGRNPTQSELNMLSAAYIDPNGHVANLSQGKSTIAQYFQNQSNTPDQINKRNQDTYLKEAPKHFDAVNQQFQNLYGRAATQDELNHFGSLLASGTTDAYGLQQFLQQQPEYTQKKDASFRSGLESELSGYDKTNYEKNILPTIQSAFAKSGRSMDSSGFASAAALAAQDQSTERGKYIAGLSASQYEGSKDRAYKDYADAVVRANNLTDSGINATYTGNLRMQDRVNQIQDYNTQAQMYNQYLAKYGKRNNGVGQLVGGAIGTGIGAYFGGPTGASVGYQLGSGFGGATQNSFGGGY